MHLCAFSSAVYVQVTPCFLHSMPRPLKPELELITASKLTPHTILLRIHVMREYDIPRGAPRGAKGAKWMIIDI